MKLFQKAWAKFLSKPVSTATSTGVEREVSLALSLLANLPFQLAEVALLYQERYERPLPITTLRALRAKFLDPKNTRSVLEIAVDMFGDSSPETNPNFDDWPDEVGNE